MPKATLSDKKILKLRKIWESGKYATRRDMANATGINYNTLAGLLKGNRRKAPDSHPSGNCKPYSIYGKCFMVYDDGRVWSFSRNRFIGSYSKQGYKIIPVINHDGIMENLRVHRVMLEVFVRPPKKGEVARHLDDNKRNNLLANLKWGKPKDNSKDMVRNGTSPKGEINGAAKLTDIVVHVLMREYDGSEYKPFARDFIARYRLKISMLTIVRVLRGQTWQHVTGFNFEKRSQGTLDKKAVLAIYRNLRKWKGSQKEFSRKFAEFLSSKGYSVTASSVYKAQRGITWQELYQENHNANLH